MSAKLAALATGLALAFSASSASAQGCNGGAFAGPYLGLNLGAGFANVKQTSPDDPKLSGDDTSFTIGGTAGYNIQCNNVVLGIAGDLSYLGLESRTKWTNPNEALLKDKIDWFGTVRGVIGAAVTPNTMLYFTAGVAFADLSHELTLPNAPFNGFHQKDSGWAAGYVIGGGINFLRHGNWMINVEALYVDLGSETHRYDATTVCGLNCTDTAKWDDTFWVARLGISYKFGNEPVYTPMK